MLYVSGRWVAGVNRKGMKEIALSYGDSALIKPQLITPASPKALSRI